ncbi:unnamed protein product [Amoebophrya sp. A120]|nr:unnamed protein product [Amoebophrya sp. A120]|eukprot:GSA120T00001584001.1
MAEAGDSSVVLRSEDATRRLVPEFTTFLERSGIESDQYYRTLRNAAVSLPRHVRLNPRSSWVQGLQAKENKGEKCGVKGMGRSMAFVSEIKASLTEAALQRKNAEGNKSSASSESKGHEERTEEDERTEEVVRSRDEEKNGGAPLPNQNAKRRKCEEGEASGGPPAESSVSDETAIEVRPVSWLPGFYSVFPAKTPLRTASIFGDAHVYGCDAASGAAVRALLEGVEMTTKAELIDINEVFPPRTIRVLDLCCAPGTKFCLLADELWTRALNANISVIGVDVDAARLNACHTVVAKYFSKELAGAEPGDVNTRKLSLRLECCDGREFFLQPKDGCSSITEQSNIAATKNARKKARRRMNVGETKKNACNIIPSVRESESDSHHQHQGEQQGIFDFVLVDAECSHDGSLRHVEKFMSSSCDVLQDGNKVNHTADNSTCYPPARPASSSWWDAETLTQKMVHVQSEEALQELLDLQKALLRNGFRNLKPGGLLLYSTCSFSKRQNEDLVEEFLSEYAASAVPVELFSFDAGTAEGGDESATAKIIPCEYTGDDAAGQRRTMGRFSPEKSKTSGLFLAKIKKKLTI